MLFITSYAFFMAFIWNRRCFGVRISVQPGMKAEGQAGEDVGPSTISALSAEGCCGHRTFLDSGPQRGGSHSRCQTFLDMGPQRGGCVARKFRLVGVACPKSALSAGFTPGRVLLKADCGLTERILGNAGGMEDIFNQDSTNPQ